MNKHHLLRFAFDLTDFMRSVSVLVEDGQPTSAPRLVSRSLDAAADAMDGALAAVTAGPVASIGLEDIGLDDMSLAEIIIELSQSRTNFKVWTPYDEEFKEQLKAIVPKHARGWDSDERCWRVGLDWFGNVQGLLEDFFPDIEVTYTQRAYRMVTTLAKQAEEEELRKRAQKKAQKQRQSRARAQAKRQQSTARKSASRASGQRHARESASPPPPPPPSPPREDPNDPYVILGCRPDAPDEVIKAAFKAQARLHHPDKVGGNGANREMSKISTAFDKIKRQRGW